jgi:hypothetical protein
MIPLAIANEMLVVIVAVAALCAVVGIGIGYLAARRAPASGVVDPTLKAKLDAIKEPPVAAQPVRVGAMTPALSNAPTPQPTYDPGIGLSEGLEVGEGTISQAFVADYSAQAMPGFASIYRQIAAGEMRGFLMVVGGPDRGRGVPIADTRISVGRNQGLTLTISDPGVSSHQCEIWAEGAHIMVGDAGSKNGTYVNNTRISKQPLANCDVIAFGSTKLLVTLGI